MKAKKYTYINNIEDENIALDDMKQKLIELVSTHNKFQHKQANTKNLMDLIENENEIKEILSKYPELKVIIDENMMIVI